MAGALLSRQTAGSWVSLNLVCQILLLPKEGLTLSGWMGSGKWGGSGQEKERQGELGLVYKKIKLKQDKQNQKQKNYGKNEVNTDFSSNS